MKHEKGDMWDIWNQTDHFIFTGNSYIKNNGALVMGKGIAKEVRDKFPGIDLKIGKQIPDMGDYWLILGSKVGVFQVKYHFRDRARLDLIEKSALKLAHTASQKPEERFDLNYPGIGNGNLDKINVGPLLEPLPDNVHVWTF